MLAAGPRAVPSHLSAGVLWGLLERVPAGSPLEITGPRYFRVAGVVSHRHALRPGETGRHRSIPVTAVERTILDLAERIPEVDVGVLMDRAVPGN